MLTVTEEAGTILQEMVMDHSTKKNYKDQTNYIRAISFLCKQPESKRKCIIHYIERLNRYYGIPSEFRELYEQHKVPGTFRFRICEYLTAIKVQSDPHPNSTDHIPT